MPDNPPQTPNIDPVELLAEAKTLYDIFYAFANDKKVPEYAATHAAAVKAFQHVTVPSMVGKVVGFVLSTMAEIAAGILKAFNDAKDSSGSGFQELIAAGLGDLFGTPINLTGGGTEGTGNPRAEAAATGRAIFTQFVSMLGGANGPIESAQGVANAQQFLGFGVNFAVVTAFLGIIGGLVPEIHLDELKLIGEEIHHSLGLGRLTHTAITPLVRNLISQPLDKHLRSILRPDNLAEPQLVRGLRAGLFQETDVRLQLAEKGYTDDAISFLLTDLSVKLGLAELFLLLNNQVIQEQDVINNLTITGMPEDQARLQLLAAQLASAKTQQNALLAEVENAYVSQFIDADNYNKQLATLHLSPQEDIAFRAKVGFKQETPRKRVSFAEVEAAIVENITDFGYLDSWFVAEGYDAESQNILSFQILKKIQGTNDKVKFAQYKANVLQQKGKPVPPWITAAINQT